VSRQINADVCQDERHRRKYGCVHIQRIGILHQHSVCVRMMIIKILLIPRPEAASWYASIYPRLYVGTLTRTSQLHVAQRG